MTSEPDDDFVVGMAEEVAALAPLNVILQPHTVMTLVGALQLAKRHPQLPPSTRAVLDQFLDGVRTYFADCPFVLEAIRRGEDRRFDT